jgi:hypothetical protein
VTVLRWETPDSTRTRIVFTEQLKAELRARPGEWAVVREYPNDGNSAPKTPPGFESQIRYVSRSRSILYARAVDNPVDKG